MGDPSNYRPIAVVPVVAKVATREDNCDSVWCVFRGHNLLHPHQGAYHCGKSTSDIFTLAVDHIVQSIDMGQAVCVSLLDLRKAFDSLSILLQQICE